MPEYTVTFARSARKELEYLSANVVNRVFPKIESLARNPRPLTVASSEASRTFGAFASGIIA